MELNILDSIQALRNPLFDAFFKVFTTLGNHAEIWLVILAIIFFTTDRKKTVIYALVALLLEVFVVEGVLKHIVQRPRPFIVNPDINLLIPVPSGYSFPSGHTASSFAIAFYLYLDNVPYKKSLLSIAILMGFSRLYVYVHFPTDVVMGAIVGMIVAASLHHFVQQRQGIQEE